MKKTTRKGIGFGRSALAVGAFLFNGAFAQISRAQDSDQENSPYAGASYIGKTLYGEAGYKTSEWGIAGFGEEGVGGIKGGLFDLTKANLDLTGALYFGDALGVSAHAGVDVPIGEGYNLRPEIGTGYFKAGDKDITVGVASLLAQRQFGRHWTFSAGARAYTDDKLTGNSVEGIIVFSYGQKPRNFLTHISGLKGLEGRLTRDKPIVVEDAVVDRKSPKEDKPTNGDKDPGNGDNGDDDDDGGLTGGGGTGGPVGN
jgi:hypothetical protein